MRTASADDGDRFDGRTITVQVGGAVAGGLLLGAGGGLVGGLLGSSAGGRNNWAAPLVGAGIGVIVGGATGVVIGVKKSGDWMDGTGTWIGIRASE